MGDLWSKQDEKVDTEKEPDVATNKNRNVHFFVAYSHYFSTSIHTVMNRMKRSFERSCLRVRMSYLRFYDLAEFLTETSLQKLGGKYFPSI